MIVEEITRVDVRSIRELPTLPVYFNRIMATLQDEESTVDELAAIVSEDTALCARLLKLANSAYYNRTSKVVTIKQVIMTLGFNEVKALSLSIAVFDICDEDVPSDFLAGLWQHALTTARATGQLCSHMSRDFRSEVYLCGLLHDVGKLAFLVLCGRDYVRVLDGQNPEYSILAREEMGFGINHAQLGAWLAGHWGFPEDLIEAIEHHHRPDVPILERRDLVSAVYLASLVADSDDPELLTREDDPAFEAALVALGLDALQFEEVCQAASNEACLTTEMEAAC